MSRIADPRIVRSPWIWSGIAVLAATAAWQFGVARRWTQRLPAGWSWEAAFVGISAAPDERTGRLAEKDTTVSYRHRIRLVSEAGRPRAVTLEDTYSLYDYATSQKTWEYVYPGGADPRTGERVEPEYRGDYFVFPRDVQKRGYSLRFTYLEGIPVRFEREEVVEGISTYLFSYRGRAEYTKAYAGSADYQGVRIQPGQEIRCLDDQFSFKVWVEPVTGEIVRWEDSCYSGDYVHDVATGRSLRPVLRWAAATSGDDVILRAERIGRERLRYLWSARYGPALGLFTGLLLATAGVIRRRAA